MTGSGLSQIQTSDQTKLTRGLKSRHIELIAIGGAIGVGLFLGSAKAIQNGGPGLILGYAFGGVMIFFIMRALGELLLYRPVAGSFVMYADEFIGPFAGFATGWSYWFMWVVTGMAELTAIGVYVGYWLPDLPQWIPVLAALVVLYSANMLAVRVFGEMEFWFALIKVAMIVMLIVGGLAVILFRIGDLGATAGFSNLWSHGGLLPFGILGVLLTFQMDIGALIVIMSLVPWNQLDPRISPFVVAFTRLGIPGAADIVNLVVITAAMSSCNSGLYSTGRMLHALAQISQAPSALGAINRRSLPAAAINVSAALMLVGVFLNFLVPDQVFIWVTSVALIGTLWTWGIIMLAHLGYRKAVHEGRAHGVAFRMPGAPLANRLVVGFLIVVAALLSVDPGTRVALYVAPIWFGLLGVAYVRMKSRPRQNVGFAAGQSPLP
ncbi:MAG: proline-specific permease ProY [Alphaproteobacteria bacterium 13_2_20CM_2_64_7]|nr:MAG: proline-specific permease ProY [Alphaproteobacteria bacterium 13_2_20CM_2_64_7]